MKNIAVVIPIYKNNPTKEELFSIENTISKLNDIDCFFIAPYGIDSSAYKHFITAQFIFLRKKFFRGLYEYNRLMLSIHFYKKFKNYKYLLLVQPDAFVFHDSAFLNNLIEKYNYDYWGAPWKHVEVTNKFNFSLYHKWLNIFNPLFKFLGGPAEEIYVGNGGLTLRNVRNTINLLCKNLFFKLIWGGNEDVFFAYFGKKSLFYKIADSKIASSFSLEETFHDEIHNNSLPFGIHDWENYFPDLFDHITAFNHDNNYFKKLFEYQNGKKIIFCRDGFNATPYIFSGIGFCDEDYSYIIDKIFEIGMSFPISMLNRIINLTLKYRFIDYTVAVKVYINKNYLQTIYFYGNSISFSFLLTEEDAKITFEIINDNFSEGILALKEICICERKGNTMSNNTLGSFFIFGAGKYANNCYKTLKSVNLFPKAFIVSDTNNNPGNIEGIPVIRLEKAIAKEKDSSLIVALKEKKTITDELMDMGFNNIDFYPEIIDVVFEKIIYELKCKKKIYIYGAGKLGSYCVQDLLTLGIVPKGVVVTNTKNNPDNLYGIKVFSISDLPQEEAITLIIALKQDFRDEVLDSLRLNKESNILFFPECRSVFDYLRIKQGNINNNAKHLKQLAWDSRKDFSIPPFAFGVSKERQEKEEKTIFEKDVKFSILVPLFNTNPIFLQEMIASVLNQTYSNWELCLADGSDDNHPDVEKKCKEISGIDKRIKYKKLQKNLGISGNTNECFDMASGDYISLLDHDDLLHPSALFETMKAICDKQADFVYTDEAVFKDMDLHNIISVNYKPDFAPDYFNSCNYITHFACFNRKLLADNIRFNSECDGAQDYDLFLHLIEKANNIVHIPKCLYFWRGTENSTSYNLNSKPYANVAGQIAVQKHLDRQGIPGKVMLTNVPFAYRIKYKLVSEPLISIIIPTCDHWEILKQCIESIIYYSTYKNYEIILVENNSHDAKTFDYYDSLKKDSRIKIITWKGKFNYSAINNYAINYVLGEYILLLNNDTSIISPSWIEEMLMFAQRKDVGAVGAMLYYPNEKIQHAGVIVGMGGVAGHAHKHFPRGAQGYFDRLCTVQNYSAITGACMMIKHDLFCKLKGFNEKFEVAFNDIDLCMRIRKAGYNIVWTPFAELYHYESESRGYEDTPEKQKRFNKECDLFKMLWGKELKQKDPCYNCNLSLSKEDFSYIGDVFDN